MNLLRKIGTGVISLGLISSFYIPESKANPTILKLEMSSNELSGGSSYSTKIKNSLLAHEGSGKNKDLGHKNWEKGSGSGMCHKHKWHKGSIIRVENYFKSCKRT